jgi:preprotein translocase subunit SecA
MIDRLATHAFGRMARPFVSSALLFRPLLLPLRKQAMRLEAMDEAAFAAHVATLRPRALRGERITLPAFAAVREAARRRLGQRHFDAQILGGLAMRRGYVAEMRTGEGKTLTATLPAATAALARVPVHVLTVNDYLAQRDATTMRPVYEALGLTVGCVLNGMPTEERRSQYRCDVVYVTNKELVFDWLRDGLSLPPGGQALARHARRVAGGTQPDLVLRGLHCAVVDEADSVLLDEARTPLVISADTGADPQQAVAWRQALALAARLQEAEHFTLERGRRVAELTPAGEARLADLAAGLGPAWASRPHRGHLARQALAATYLFARDVDYLVSDDTVQIIDEATGRTMPDRRWDLGLHQMVETKEAVPPTAERRNLASVSYQRFFRHYHHLCGMSGTAREVSGELWDTYGLAVMRIPTNRPMRMRLLPTSLCDDQDAKWNLVTARVRTLHAAGQPVLIGTRTVGASETLSAALTRAALPHALLNARLLQQEAEVVAEAGQAGRITIATNMAGRGTDIALGPGVAAAGGLHVLGTELHESGRVDRQLAGRCARQGDPGSTELVLALDDHLLAENAPGWAALLAHMPAGRLRTTLALRAMRRAQRKLERRHAEDRATLLLADEHEAETLGFAGAR